uniref:Uncharacterized protein n=1 Tax=Populus trichocarpa TaxID=3694 RepID=A9PED0_POPTR|nr:unknown [Populus trichocarpa]
MERRIGWCTIRMVLLPRLNPNKLLILFPVLIILTKPKSQALFRKLSKTWTPRCLSLLGLSFLKRISQLHQKN